MNRKAIEEHLNAIIENAQVALNQLDHGSEATFFESLDGIDEHAKALENIDFPGGK